MTLRHAVCRTLFSLTLVAVAGAAAAQSTEADLLQDVPEAWFGQSDTRSIGLTSDAEWRLAMRPPRAQDGELAPAGQTDYSIAAFPRLDRPSPQNTELEEMTPAVPWDLEAPDYDYHTEATWFADWYGDADLEN